MKLLKTGVIGIGSKEHAGGTNFLKYILSTLIKRRDREPVKLYIVDNFEKKLAGFKKWEEQVSYSGTSADGIRYLNEVSGILEERYRLLLAGEDDRLKSEALQVIVINNADCYEALGDDGEAMETYKQIISKYRTLKVCFVMAQMPNANLNFGAPSVLKVSRDVINLYLFYNIAEQKVTDIPLSVQKEFAKPLEVGGAFNIYAGNLEKIKTPLYEEGEN